MKAETIEGRIRRIRYHQVTKGSHSGIPWMIAELKDGRVVAGEILEPDFDVTYRFIGEWRPDRRGNGEMFAFNHFDEVIETKEGAETFLARKIEGLNRRKAKALCEHLGDDTIRILQTRPERALEVPGITQEIVAAIRQWFADNRRIDPMVVLELTEMFAGRRFPRKLAETLAGDFGSDAPKVVRDEPYILLSYPRMGWKLVDPFALDQGYAQDGIGRHRAAIVESFERLSTREGHTYATRGEIESIAYDLIGMRPSPTSWVAAVQNGDIISHEYEGRQAPWLDDRNLVTALGEIIEDDASTYSLPKIALAEQNIARKLANLTAMGLPLLFKPSVAGLNDDQARAIRMIAEHPVSLLLGAPGTGKTYTISRFVRSCVENGVRAIRDVAPTGKAAKRAEELIVQAVGDLAVRILCTTVHRALEPQPSAAPLGVPEATAKIGRGRDTFEFGRGEHNPLEVDILIVDETSMLDVRLADRLLGAVAPGTRIIFVGDIHQLPSVGPGAVLRDMMYSGVIPFIELSRIVRSDGGGRVVRACHSIKDGRVPEPAETFSLPLDNWIHIEVNDPADILEEIVDLYSSIRANGNYDPYWGVQVVAPQKDIEHIGCKALNRRLSDLLNPQTGPVVEEEPGFKPDFRIGDKVVRRKNGVVDLIVPFDRDDIGSRVDWRWKGGAWSLREVDVVNGDMGTVEDIIIGQGDKSYVVVRFRNPDRLCRLPYGETHLEPAFACTVHTAQGSGFPIVIIPTHLSYHWDPRTGTGLNSRELFYTAISRAEKGAITVGQFAAIEAVISRKTVDFRRTRLATLLRETFAVIEDGESEVSLESEIR